MFLFVTDVYIERDSVYKSFGSVTEVYMEE